MIETRRIAYGQEQRMARIHITVAREQEAS